jgi:hypothetical protein
LIALIALPALLVAGCGGSSDDDGTVPIAVEPGTKEISGPWAGELAQARLAPFRVAVVIGENGTGRVAYTGIDCGGRWVLDSANAPNYVFTETINEGAGGECKGTGTVHLIHTPEGSLRYRFEGGGVTSQGSLAPASVHAIIAVFRQAGLPLTPGSTATVAD